MAFRLLSNHRMRFSPQYVGGSAAILTKSARRLLTVHIKSQLDFEEQVLKSSIPVIVDFHASWCGPCKTLSPVLDSVMKTYEGKVNLAKVDVDLLGDIAMEYDVMSVPTVLALKDGIIVDQFIGMKQIDDVQNFVKNILDE